MDMLILLLCFVWVMIAAMEIADFVTPSSTARSHTHISLCSRACKICTLVPSPNSLNKEANWI